MNETYQRVKELAANGSSVEELWLLFKSKHNQSVNNHIPHKTAKQKDSLPWLTPNIRKLIHRRDRLYKKKKKSADPKITSKFIETKQMVQRELRRAYWKYIENIVTPKEENNQYSSMKQFWTYIKHKRTESSGVAHTDLPKINRNRDCKQDAINSLVEWRSLEQNEKSKARKPCSLKIVKRESAVTKGSRLMSHSKVDCAMKLWHDESFQIPAASMYTESFLYFHEPSKIGTVPSCGSVSAAQIQKTLGPDSDAELYSPPHKLSTDFRRPGPDSDAELYSPPHKLSNIFMYNSEDLGSRQRRRVYSPPHKLSNIFMYNSEDLGSRQRCGTARPHKLSTDSEDLGSRQRFGVTAPPHKLSTDSEDLGSRQRFGVTAPPHKLSTDSEDLGPDSDAELYSPPHKLSNIFMYNSEDLGSRQRCGTARPHKLSTDSEDLGTRQRRRVIQPTSQVKHRLRRPWGQTATQSYTVPPHKLNADPRQEPDRPARLYSSKVKYALYGLFEMLPRERRLPEEELKEAEKLVSLQVNNKLMRDHLSLQDKTGKKTSATISKVNASKK
ncbi:Hypothetical predicted protein [Mytilus galloprovincialis]|uniref:Uncharacterized protein n=1 Tax=Mytilus galloprovincialis TaxID=29158 RepID=A0A8B6DPB9_MYTGA|nr:Hypothetical predicted protein [Mytilus galloprovincialis]